MRKGCVVTGREKDVLGIHTGNVCSKAMRKGEKKVGLTRVMMFKSRD